MCRFRPKIIGYHDLQVLSEHCLGALDCAFTHLHIYICQAPMANRSFRMHNGLGIDLTRSGFANDSSEPSKILLC